MLIYIYIWVVYQVILVHYSRDGEAYSVWDLVRTRFSRDGGAREILFTGSRI